MTPFNEFLKVYHPDREIGRWPYADPSDGVGTLLEVLGGRSYNAGLYRIHNRVSAAHWAPIISEGFPSRPSRAHAFGFDWQGRQFCVDQGSNLVVLFDPETRESYATNLSLFDFHDRELVECGDEALSSFVFGQWSATQSAPLRFDECVAYRIPLMLSGEEVLENRQRCNMEVYWSFCTQIHEQIKDLEPGTPITSVHLFED